MSWCEADGDRFFGVHQGGCEALRGVRSGRDEREKSGGGCVRLYNAAAMCLPLEFPVVSQQQAAESFASLASFTAKRDIEDRCEVA